MKELWVEKYRPSTIDGYVFRDGHQKDQVQSWIKQGTTLGKYQLAKQEYDNARRIFRSRMNATDFAEVLGSIRNGIVGSLKN